ncbi:MAG: hypothetical protein M0C28_07805 [Candidatus Moduliflexus flocculans]|nr:hypothetical protein [Candidatus Moduliflexus flocculans]
MILAVGCGSESRAERDPASSSPPVSQAMPAGQPQAPIFAVKGEVLATSRLDIDFCQVPGDVPGARRRPVHPLQKNAADHEGDRRHVPRPGPGRLLRRLEGPRAGREIPRPADPDPGLSGPEGQGDRPPRRALSQRGDPRAPEEARDPVS